MVIILVQSYVKLHMFLKSKSIKRSLRGGGESPHPIHALLRLIKVNTVTCEVAYAILHWCVCVADDGQQIASCILPFKNTPTALAHSCVSGLGRVDEPSSNDFLRRFYPPICTSSLSSFPSPEILI